MFKCPAYAEQGSAGLENPGKGCAEKKEIYRNNISFILVVPV